MGNVVAIVWGAVPSGGYQGRSSNC